MDEETWRQHLEWLQLGIQQVDENIRRLQKQRECAAAIENQRRMKQVPW